MNAGAQETKRLSTKSWVLITLSSVIAVSAVFISASVITPEIWTGMIVEDLEITGVRFSEGFVTATVKNAGDTRYDWDVITVTEVMVQPGNATFPSCKAPMSIPIHMGERAAISVRYDWISGEIYRITVTTSRGSFWRYYTVAP